MNGRLFFAIVLVIVSLILCSTVSTSPAFADTSHCGTISSNETWSSDGNVHVVTCDVTVSSSATLTIAEGVIVKFSAGTRLIVNGTLMAVGMSSQRIYFTSIRDDTVGGDTNGDGLASSPTVNNWGWVEFGAGSTASLDYLTMRYSGNYGAGFHSPLYAIGYAIPVVGDHVSLTNNWANGIDIPGGTLSLASLTLPHYSAAAYYIRGTLTIPSGASFTVEPGAILKLSSQDRLIVDGTLTAVGTEAQRIYFTSIRDDTVGGDTNGDGLASSPTANNWGWVEFGAGSTASLDYLTMRYSGNYGAGFHSPLYAIGYAIPVVGDHVSLTNNWANGIDIPGGTLSLASLTLPRCGVAYYLRGTLTINASTVLAIHPGAIVKIGEGSALIVKGALQVLGAEDNPVYLTSIKDDEVGGDTNGDGLSSPVPGDWSRIEFQDSSNDALSLIEHAIIRYSGGWSNYGAVHLMNASPTIRNTSISNSGYYGIYTSASTPILVCNDVYNNRTYGLYNATTSVTVIAENQWWGSASGPYHSTNPSGTGNAVTDGVDFTPWRTSPCRTGHQIFLPLVVKHHL